MGVLVVHRGMQLRFYEYPVDLTYKEIYSFYSRSRQGGLLIADVDGDGIIRTLFAAITGSKA